MKILVIEDTFKHQVSARETLRDHTVTIVTSFDEAISILGDPYGRDQGKEDFDFDAVLVDMMLPASGRKLHKEVFEPSEMVPYGFPLVLRAALRGVKYIAMVTDINHHKSPLSASLDMIGSDYYHSGLRPNFVINGARVMFVHSPFVGNNDDGGKDWGRVLNDLTV